jgi:hypothetical protein
MKKKKVELEEVAIVATLKVTHNFLFSPIFISQLSVGI